MKVIVYQINGTVFVRDKASMIECLEERNLYQGVADSFDIYESEKEASMYWDLFECERIPYNEPAKYGL